ncbi:hypothetical protein LV84_01890 [Algoriphagus ratkowskyi]|uniref:Uncharacterized protein n=1 Tax=Algoriphagus ratkowskyi TaxID=57028 RepID=A0A2W7RCE3_9BACT|nr:hypothetical protein LV84_01890 [Algoriphagus ratkowskyi]
MYHDPILVFSVLAPEQSLIQLIIHPQNSFKLIRKGRIFASEANDWSTNDEIEAIILLIY